MINGATGKVTRKAPAEIERALRQEAGFGCARCGLPYIEYHHIIPFSQDNHFRAEDMMALCPTCHAAMNAVSREGQYAIKASPKNVSSGFVHGHLLSAKQQFATKLGGNTYINTPVLVRWRDQNIVSVRKEAERVMFSFNLFGSNGETLAAIVDNEFHFRVDDFWDFEYKHNWVKLRSAPRDIALSVDLRQDVATIVGATWVGGTKLNFDPNKSFFGGSGGISGCTMTNVGVGIQLG